MSDATPEAPRKSNVVPMIRRLGEAVRTILGLVHSVDQLKARNDVLTAKVDELQRKVDQQAGQLEVLLRFVVGALDDRIEKRAEAAARAVLAKFEKMPRKKKSIPKK
jgi:hypothetical protein